MTNKEMIYYYALPDGYMPSNLTRYEVFRATENTTDDEFIFSFHSKEIAYSVCDALNAEIVKQQELKKIKGGLI